MNDPNYRHKNSPEEPPTSFLSYFSRVPRRSSEYFMKQTQTLSKVLMPSYLRKRFVKKPRILFFVKWTGNLSKLHRVTKTDNVSAVSEIAGVNHGSAKGWTGRLG